MPCGTFSAFSPISPTSFTLQSPALPSDFNAFPSQLTWSLVPFHSYIRAFEVGRSPDSSKYELAIRIRSRKDGPVVRNRIRLPHAVGANYKIGVICPSPSPIATAALAAGASVCGEESLVETILLSGKKLPFDRLLCHVDSVDKLNKSGLGKVLGPRKMMPSAKLGTVTDDVPKVVSNIIGASEYREKIGVIRCAVGKLVFTPQQLNTNIRVIMESVKRDMHDLSDQILKEIHEVVSFLHPCPNPTFSPPKPAEANNNIADICTHNQPPDADFFPLSPFPPFRS